MTAIRIEVDDKQVQAAFNHLILAVADLSPVMAELAGHLEADVIVGTHRSNYWSRAAT